MPIYEFDCLDCKTVFERIVRNADAAKDVACPNCASSNIKKAISAGSHRLHTGPSLPTPGCSTKSRFS